MPHIERLLAGLIVTVLVAVGCQDTGKLTGGTDGFQASQERVVRRPGMTDDRDMASVPPSAAASAWSTLVRARIATPATPSPSPTAVPTVVPTAVPEPEPSSPEGIRSIEGLIYKGIDRDAISEFAVFVLNIDADIDLPARNLVLATESGNAYRPEVYLNGDLSRQQGYTAGSGRAELILLYRPDCRTVRLEDDGAWYLVSRGIGEIGDKTEAWGHVDGRGNCGGGGGSGTYYDGYIQTHVVDEGGYQAVFNKFDYECHVDTPMSAFTLQNEAGQTLRPYMLHIDGSGHSGFVSTIPAGGRYTVVVYFSTGCGPYDLNPGGKWQLLINGAGQGNWTGIDGTIDHGTGPCP